MEELQVVRSERDRAVREEKTLRQSLSLLEQETEVWLGWTRTIYSAFLSFLRTAHVTQDVDITWL